MMRRRNLFLFTAAIALQSFVVAPVMAVDAGAPPQDAGAATRKPIEGAKLDQLFSDIARARQPIKTFRASFVQDRRLSLLATTVRSTGELTFAAPDRMRWELFAPDDVIYFVGPEGLTYRTKSSSATVPQARSGANVAAALTDLRALTFGEIGPLRERYVLTASQGDADVELTGVAKDKNANVKSFTLLLDKGLVVPLSARLVEGKSDTIDLKFSNAVVDGPVDPRTMRP